MGWHVRVGDGGISRSFSGRGPVRIPHLCNDLGCLSQLSAARFHLMQALRSNRQGGEDNGMVSETRALSALSTTAILLMLCGCQGLTGSATTPTAELQPINHIVVMVQENRSLDTYFGQLSAYWQAKGLPAQQFDGIPAGASNPTFDGTSTVSAYHLATTCMENVTPSWDESHLDWNLHNPTSSTATMDGYVYNAAKFAMDQSPPYFDVAGFRAMGYYDDSDLNYYYFMASNFATSDRWFSPAMDRTQINRMYLFAATSQGYAYPPGTNAADNAPITAATIFDELQQAAITWKVYYSDDICSTGPPPDALAETPRGGKIDAATASNSGACTYLTQFKKYAPPNQLPSNVVPVSQYLSDVQNGALPSVGFIETGYMSGRDEHPNSTTNIQTGAAYAQSLINALMKSPSWKDSVFILTYDEGGGTYDHVPPQPAVNPDGIAPLDLPAGDVCTSGGSNCDFNYTGFRVPLLVISPFTKKNYVSHTVADYTAILKLIESRFGLQPLTQRDAAQMDMSEFFDFQNVPWSTPPSPPAQTTGGTCNPQQLQ
jgi:phospholipase C